MLSSNVGFVILEGTSACVGAIDTDLIRFTIDLSQPFQDLAQTLYLFEPKQLTKVNGCWTIEEASELCPPIWANGYVLYFKMPKGRHNFT
jgi:hypothetical protein